MGPSRRSRPRRAACQVRLCPPHPQMLEAALRRCPSTPLSARAPKRKRSEAETPRSAPPSARRKQRPIAADPTVEVVQALPSPPRRCLPVVGDALSPHGGARSPFLEAVPGDVLPAPGLAAEASDSRRVRLTAKTRPPPSFWQELVARYAETPPGWRVKRAAEQLYAAALMRDQTLPGQNYGDRRAVGVQRFRALTLPEQAQWLHRAEGDARSPPQLLAERKWRDSLPASVVSWEPNQARCGVLLTWNGSWCDSDPLLRGILLECRSEAVPRRRWGEKLRAATSLRNLFDEFWVELAGRCRAAGLLHVSAAAEVSIHAEELGRVHLHLFASLTVGSGDLKNCVARLTFRGVHAQHASPCIPSRGRDARSRAIGQAHYYLQMRKLGAVWQRTNFLKCRDFPVRSLWIMKMWRVHKMDHDDAKLELWEAREKAHAFVHEIERVQREEAEQAARAAAARSRRELRLCPFVAPSAAEVNWLRQFARVDGGCALPLRRYRCLIYDGPSRTGKTERALSWFGQDQTLAVNCQGVRSPCLKDFEAGGYRAICYEEASWELLWQNRQLFQSGLNPVLLGQSQCNEHAYWVNVFGTPQLATSNNFFEGCECGEARAWIASNAFYVRVTSPLFRTA